MISSSAVSWSSEMTPHSEGIHRGTNRAYVMGMAVLSGECGRQGGNLRAGISSNNWSGGTKNGFSQTSPPMITTGCVRKASIITLAPNLGRLYEQITQSSYLGIT